MKRHRRMKMGKELWWGGKIQLIDRNLESTSQQRNAVRKQVMLVIKNGNWLYDSITSPTKFVNGSAPLLPFSITRFIYPAQ